MALLIFLLLGIIAWQAALLRMRPTQSATDTQTLALPSSSSSRAQSEGTTTSTDDAQSPGQKKPANTAAHLMAESATNSQSNWPRFDWGKIESEDYHTYIKNLRAIGCPEPTIRDIVTADLQGSFADRRAEIMASAYRDFKFWETGPEQKSARQELERQRHALDSQASAALSELLGTPISSPNTDAQWRQAEMDQQLAFLPEDKREQSKALLVQYADIDRLAKSLSEASRLPEDPAERRLIWDEYEKKSSQLASILSADQFEQLDMTVSWTADNVRRGVGNFQPTEEEFRAIFKAWRPHDELLVQLYATGEPDPGNSSVYASIRQALGEERYQEYRRNWWNREQVATSIPKR